MTEHEIVSATSKFQPLAELLSTDITLQMAIATLIIGIIIIFSINQKLSGWVNKTKFRHTSPYAADFVKKIALSLLATGFIIIISIYIQVFELFNVQSAILAAQQSETLTPRETFAKILNTIIILVGGYSVAHLIPVIVSKKEITPLEKEDFEAWKEMHGFLDDEENLFYKLYKWVPPKKTPAEFSKEEWKEKLKTNEGRKFLENFRTSKGIPLGGYKELKPHPFFKWKQSEREKYEKYYKDCISGENESGHVLKPGVIPSEIYPIDVWREQKRFANYDPIKAGGRPPGWSNKHSVEDKKSLKQVIPIIIFVAILIGIAAWWGVDLVVIATASGGLAIGIGFALQETMQNYFAYISIRKDKIVIEGDRVKLENGYIGVVNRITPRVTYIRHGLNESVAIIPTKQLVGSTVVNYSKDTHLVPAIVDVGVSYLNDPEEVASVLMKVGQQAMREIKDSRGRHLIIQEKCPYRKKNKASCGCDKDTLFDFDQPRIRVNNFNDSSIDYSVWVFVKDYGTQFRVKSDIRVMIIKEFKKHDIRIPWPIQWEYVADLNRDLKEIAQKHPERRKTLEKYGTGDLTKLKNDEESI